MISFIIIGRNEGWKLKKCLKSIFETIEYNEFLNVEVIYIDSKSTDDSIEYAKSFENVKVFLITGACNAAIARNIGAVEAKGDILFFIDGDMEINKEFLSLAIENNQLKYDCITGHLDDYLYDIYGNFLCVKARTYHQNIPIKEQVLRTNGGVFLIKKQIWESVSGLKTKLKINEDNDLTLRLIKRRINTIRIPALIVKHHTVDYNDDKRMWNDMKNLHSFYPGLIFREHFFNTIAWLKILRSNYTAFLLLATFFSLILNIKSLLLVCSIIYLFVLFIRVLKKTNEVKVFYNKGIYFFERLIIQFLHDLLFWVGFIFYYPSSKKLEYQSINI